MFNHLLTCKEKRVEFALRFILFDSSTTCLALFLINSMRIFTRCTQDHVGKQRNKGKSGGKQGAAEVILFFFSSFTFIKYLLG